jgi:hypothetical protein
MMILPLVILSLITLQGAVHGQASTATTTSTASTSGQTTTSTTIRIELDPDATSVNGICTNKFNANLTAQLSIWFTDGVASYNRAYPQVAGPVTFTNTFRNAGGGSNRLVQEEPSFGIVEGQQERNLCNKNGCTGCCPAACLTFCGGGGCNLCKNDDDDVRRQLRGGASRMMATGSNAWYAGNATMQSSVAQSIQFAAQQWLSQNDPTQCMGYAWKLAVVVSYI